MTCEEGPALCSLVLTILSASLVLFTLPLSLLLVVRVVQEFERAVIFRLGRLVAGGARGPGVFFVLPGVDRYEIIDMRTQTFDIPPQEVSSACGANKLTSEKQILTKDSVTVFVNAIMYYRVTDAIRALAIVEDAGGSAQLLAATTLRNCLSIRNLGQAGLSTLSGFFIWAKH